MAKSNGIKQFQWLWLYSRGLRGPILVTISLSCAGVLFSIAFVDCTKLFLDKISNHIALNILYAALWLIGLKLFQILCEQSEIYLRSINKVKLDNDIEYKLFCSLTDSKYQTNNRIHSGDSIYRLSSDVGIVAESIAYTFPILIYSVVQLIATWVYLAIQQPYLTIILGIISPIIIIATYFYTRCLTPISNTIRRDGAKVNAYIQEHIQNKELINVFEKQGFVQANVKSLQHKFLLSLTKRIRLNVGADSLTELGFAASYLIVFIWGMFGISNGSVSYGVFIVFIQLVGQLQRPIFIFKDQYPSFVSSLASVDRLKEISDLPSSVADKKTFIAEKVGLKFENVYFRYSFDSEWILSDFTYNFKPGSITAVLGETGIGKSTMIKLALGLLNPNEGKISVYSEDDSKHLSVGSHTLCNFVFAPQGNNILSGTIRYNLQLGNPEATDSQMRNALYVAAADFVNDLPDGLDTYVGEKGYSLSEGQSQRISIARSLLRNGGILILDEPTSAIDKQTEKRLYNHLKSFASNKTIIVITHRMVDKHFYTDVLDFDTYKNHKQLKPQIQQ